ncbi:MAG TPA: triose-phosphate isomerase, partial [Nitrososphaerales archaeon]|nr:triose-phosphate isomerase [Nitrososphaerales archaeon]
MGTLIVNCKNYPEVLGEGSLRMALAVKRVAEATKVDAVVAPPTPMLGLVASRTRARVFSQTVASRSGDKTTGAIVPEAVKAAGGAGTILNHSESRRSPAELSKLVPRVTAMGLAVCLCAGTSQEAARLAKLSPAYIAVEPPELIGTGIAVSRAKP